MNLPRTLRCSVLVIAAATAVVWMAGHALGLGFMLGQTKKELKLEYDVSVYDHKTGRVTIKFTLADEGRLKPLDAVQLSIPGKKKNKDGGNWMDLVVAIDMKKTDGGKRVGRIHILKELAERAEIWLNTHTMDGKKQVMTRLHHIIKIEKYMKSAKTNPKKPAPPPPPSKRASPAAERNNTP